MDQFHRIGAFIAVPIISGSGKIIRTTVAKTHDRILSSRADIDRVEIIAAGGTVVNIVAGQIGFAIGIPCQADLRSVSANRNQEQKRSHCG